jgi:hypothetical protein
LPFTIHRESFSYSLFVSPKSAFKIMAVPPLLSPFLFTPSPARGLGRTRTHEADIVRTTHDEHHPTDYFSIRK